MEALAALSRYRHSQALLKQIPDAPERQAEPDVEAARLGLDWDSSSGTAMKALEQALLRLSGLVCTLPEVTDLDINPMIVDTDSALAVDARLHIRPATEDRAYSHMAIMPYPAHLARRVTLPDGAALTLRPIRPEDARMEAEFVRALSPRSRYFRFMEHVNELVETARARGLKRMEGQVLSDNRGMLALTEQLGFEQERDRSDYRMVNVYCSLGNP